MDFFLCVIFWFFVFVLLFFLFVFERERKRSIKLGLGGEGEDLGGIGRGENMIKIHDMKIIVFNFKN